MVNKTNVKIIIIIIIIIIILILIIILMIMMTMTMMLMMMMMMMMMLLMMVFYSDFHYNMDLHLILRGTIEIYDIVYLLYVWLKLYCTHKECSW